MLNDLIDLSAADALASDSVEPPSVVQNFDIPANLVPSTNRDDLFENTCSNNTTIDLTQSPHLSLPSLQNLTDVDEDQRR